MTDQMIAKLLSKGFTRWTKGNFDRLYINAVQLGLVCSYYNTGNISYAEFNGERISNCEARRMKAAKTFVDVKAGTLYSDNSDLKEAAEKLISEAEDEIAAEEAASAEVEETAEMAENVGTVETAETAETPIEEFNALIDEMFGTETVEKEAAETATTGKAIVPTHDMKNVMNGFDGYPVIDLEGGKKYEVVLEDKYGYYFRPIDGRATMIAIKKEYVGNGFCVTAI